MRRIKHGPSEILVARMPGGEVVAFATHCPHQGTPLKHAVAIEGNLRCPQHNYMYDPRTGRNVYPAASVRLDVLWRLKPGYLTTYRVEERDGWIWVAERPNPPPPAGAQRPAAPAALQRTPAGPPPPPRPAGPVEHPEESLTVAVGAEFELSLPTNPLPGHIWKVEISGDAVALVGQVFDLEGTRAWRLRLAARGPGSAGVRCMYTKPWGERAVAKEIRSFCVQVDAAG